MASKKRERLQITVEDGVTIVNLGPVEIWDGADLALLRETLTRLIDVDRCPAIGVDMTTVKYIPSGFFGMLFEWYERGIRVHLYSPQPNVERMLWFRMFFRHECENCFRLFDDPQRSPAVAPVADWTVDRSERDDSVPTLPAPTLEPAKLQ